MRFLVCQLGWTAIGILAAGALGAGEPAFASPAGTMLELRDHFAACFHPSAATAGSRVTFYFSIDANGQVVARPRTVLFGFKGTQDEKGRQLALSTAAFAQCLPLSMSGPLAASIPGKVYFLQYAVAASGVTTEVLFRPFGSHGGGGGGFVQPPGGLDFEPLDPVIPPVRISPVPAWMVRPPFRPLFPPVVVPIPPRFPGRMR